MVFSNVILKATQGIPLPPGPEFLPQRHTTLVSCPSPLLLSLSLIRNFVLLMLSSMFHLRNINLKHTSLEDVRLDKWAAQKRQVSRAKVTTEGMPCVLFTLKSLLDLSIELILSLKQITVE